jgi:hypothetical protein
MSAAALKFVDRDVFSVLAVSDTWEAAGGATAAAGLSVGVVDDTEGKDYVKAR